MEILCGVCLQQYDTCECKLCPVCETWNCEEHTYEVETPIKEI